MHRDDRLALKLWVGIIATGLWAGATVGWAIGWVVHKTREGR